MVGFPKDFIDFLRTRILLNSCEPLAGDHALNNYFELVYLHKRLKKKH